ncbi:MAG: hypothetical protein JWQ81_944 [Amycolatopsis sp.]|uniref:restriction system modified-DNA reader domain-containing protein n=1 Tax=Amycolatopsis sp. TaxID=37632 RepID=UPI00262962D0|nr:hypothetical protein [Amycolatopsis sp.]MCU1680205.1 hypothetical protein [Amycolatopsis sp.]
MTTDHDNPEPPEPTPSATVDTPQPAPAPVAANATTGASQPHDEASIREWEGLRADTIILTPAFTATPMRSPDNVWAMLVSAVAIVGDTDPDRAGEVALFAGQWVVDQPPADSLYDGDLVVRLSSRASTGHENEPRSRDVSTDVEMLLARHGRWQRVAQWHGVDDHWPRIVAPTAAAVMGLHCDLTEAVSGFEDTVALDAEAGDELGWNRRNLEVRHTARIRADGTIALADGRVFATPSGAATALSGHQQNGWVTFQRASDGRTLGDLRAELRARSGQ